MADLARKMPESSHLAGLSVGPVDLANEKTLLRHRDLQTLGSQSKDSAQDLRKGTGCASLGVGRVSPQARLPDFTCS